MAENSESLQEMHMLEHQLQQILMQRQAFQMELSETESTLGYLGKTEDDVYKMVGQLMLKVKKEEVKKDLEQKQKLLSTRMDALQKREEDLLEKVEAVREKVLDTK